MFAVDLSVWHRSVHYIGPGLSTLLGNFQVIILAAWGLLFLGEKLGWRLKVAVPMAIIGLLLIFGGDLSVLRGEYGLGVFFGLLTAVTYSIFLLSLRFARGMAGAPGPVTAMAVVSFFAVPFAGIGSLSLGESFAIPDIQSLSALTAYGLFSQVIGWSLIAFGLPKIRASRAGLILLLQPSLALVWDYLFFAKAVLPWETAGVILALAAIYLGSRGTESRLKSSG